MIEFLKDLWQFARKHKKLWIVPIIIIMMLASFLIIFVQGSSVSPFIYALF
jgi:hypothetical protein